MSRVQKRIEIAIAQIGMSDGRELGIDNHIIQLIYFHCQQGKLGIEKNLEDYI